MRKLMLEQRKKVESFIEAIRDEKDGFILGKPWRYDDKSLTCVIPIHRKVDGTSPYITLSQAKKVEIKDTGNISKAKIKNNEDKPVFLRLGELLKGDTQERSVTASRIIFPGEEAEIDIVCVHASKGIRPGAVFEYGGYTPKKDAMYAHFAYSTGLTGGVNQQDSWQSDRDYTLRTRSFAQCYAGRGTTAASPFAETHSPPQGQVQITYLSGEGVESQGIPIDDITQVRDQVNKLLEDVIKAVPLFEDQTGLILIDTQGFHSLDCYNLKQPYQAVKDALVGKESTTIADRSDEEGVFDYKPEKAKEVIGKALDKAFEENVIHDSERTQTIALSIDKYIGEAVTLDGQVIHLLLARK